jgi:hypothetical protein
VLRCVLIVCASCTLLLDSAQAQNQAVAWPPLSHISASSLYIERPSTPLDVHLLAAEMPDTTPRQIKPTHWREGGMVGSLLIGAFGTWFGYEICRYVEDGGNGCGGFMIRGALGGGITGFLIGALIGGQFPKHPKSVPPEPS